MTIEEIMEALKPYSPLLKEALDEAVRRKEEVTPALLAGLQKAADDLTIATDGAYSLHIAAAFLLAQFREQAAFPPLTALLAHDDDTVGYIWGDHILTDAYPSMLRDTFNGDVEPLRRVIEDRSCSPFARWSALTAYALLFVDGRVTRRELTRYLRRLIRVVYAGDLNEEDIMVVTALACVVVDLHLIEMAGDVKELHDNDFIDETFYGGYENFLKNVNDFSRSFFEDRHIDDAAEALKDCGWFDAKGG